MNRNPDGTLISTDSLEEMLLREGADPVEVSATKSFMDPVEFRAMLLDQTRDVRERLFDEGKLSFDARTPLNTPGYSYPT